MERPNIEKESPEIIAYIDWLEKRVDGAGKLAKEVSLLKAGVAHDLELIRNGEEGNDYEHLKYVCLDKLSPRYNLVKVLMLTVKSVEDDSPAKPVGRPAKEPKETEEVETLAIAGELDKPEPVATERGNVFELASKKIAANATR